MTDRKKRSYVLRKPIISYMLKVAEHTSFRQLYCRFYKYAVGRARYMLYKKHYSKTSGKSILRTCAAFHTKVPRNDHIRKP